MKDLYSAIGVAAVLAPVVLTDTSTSDPVDLIGFNSAALVVTTGAVAGSGVFATKLQHSDTTTAGDFVDVEPDELLGALPTALAANSVYKAGYKGSKRYLRTVTTKVSGTSIAAAITLVRSDAANAPVA